jgi:hypothetical protein
LHGAVTVDEARGGARETSGARRAHHQSADAGGADALAGCRWLSGV